MQQEILAKIRAKSREEWRDLALARIAVLRILVQEHAEIAFVAGVGIGILFVLAFKLIIFLLVVAVLVGFLIWNIARPESECERVKLETPPMPQTVMPQTASSADEVKPKHSPPSTPSGNGS